MKNIALVSTIGSLLLLGACASVPNPDKVAANYVSAKQFVYADCAEMAEEMARAKYQVDTAKTKEKIAEAKGEYEAIVRAGYSKHCGDARYSGGGVQQPVVTPQIIVVQPAPRVVRRIVYQQYPQYQNPSPPPQTVQPQSFQYHYSGGYPNQ